MKNKKKFSLRKIFIISIFVFIITISFVILVFSNKLLVSNSPFDDMQFDRAEWLQQKNSDNPDNKRGMMYDDIVKNVIKQGMSQIDVVSLLGEPDFGITEYIYSYNIGMWSGYRMDYDSLEIEFDKNHRVIKVYRLQH